MTTDWRKLRTNEIAPLLGKATIIAFISSLSFFGNSNISIIAPKYIVLIVKTAPLTALIRKPRQIETRSNGLANLNYRDE